MRHYDEATGIWEPQPPGTLRACNGIALPLFKMVKNRCDDKERQIKVAKMSEMNSPALYLGMNFSRVKITCTECCDSKEIICVSRFVAGVWKLKGN
jgi:hypothetical protein